MGEKVEKVRADFHNVLALLGLMSEHYGHPASPSIEDVDKASPAARQWRARGAAADPPEHGRRACEVSAQTATWRAKLRHRGAVELRRCPRSAPLFSAPLSENFISHGFRGVPPRLTSHERSNIIIHCVF